jgi:hypothetical protein
METYGRDLRLASSYLPYRPLQRGLLRLRVARLHIMP